MMGRVLPAVDSLTLRFLAVVALSVGITIGLMVAMFTWGDMLSRPVMFSFSERVAGIVAMMDAAPPADRAPMAARASSPALAIGWRASLPAGAGWPDNFPDLRQRLAHALDDPARRLAILPAGTATAAEGGAGPTVVAVSLGDGSWVTVSSPNHVWYFEEPRHALLPLSLLAVSALVVCVGAAKMLSAPIGGFVAAVERFGGTGAVTQLPERGPREMRPVIRAFNAMQARIEQTMTDRLAMVGALSHDLRTPLARLRLRTEFSPDSEDQRRVLRDLDEMGALIDHSLAFLRDDTRRETATPVDIAVLLVGIAEDQADLGRQVAFHGPGHAAFLGRPVALKRAFANLVENAVKFGTQATIELHVAGDSVSVVVLDDGPGIPPALHETVFKPFFRQERSRNRATGGVGLGLAIARGVVRAHGGEITLANHVLGGLAVTTVLPVGRG